MSGSTSYVRTDEHGVMRVGGTRVMIDSVVVGFQQGLSAETIQQQYPALTLEEVYGAIAYYLGHREQVEQYLQRQQRAWDDSRNHSIASSGAVVSRLRAARATGAYESS